MNSLSYKQKNECICCESDDLELLLDLGHQPLANSYTKEPNNLDLYPLGLNRCEDCYHLQLTHIVPPDLLFKNYLYVSGTTKTLRDNFEWFSDLVLEYKPDMKNVLDIACNDGSQLDCFKKKGIETYGIDPAENLYKISSKNHNVICDYFHGGHYTDPYIERTWFDIITAQNVFAHNENAYQFLKDCENILAPDGYVFIQTSQAEMILNNEFDTIYHEHLSFFNINSLNTLVHRTGFNLIDVIKSPVHGTSYIFVLHKTKMKPSRIKNLLDLEESRGLHSLKTYEKYKDNVMKIKNDFKREFFKYQASGYKTIGYGAAAKGMTFLNFCEGINLDYIIDDNPMKHELYTPRTNIQIKPPEFLKSYTPEDKILFIPLAWNFYEEIRGRILKVRENPQDVFLKYFPHVEDERV